MITDFKRLFAKIVPYQTILNLIAAWLTASAFINWINHQTPSYFSVRYAGLEGLTPLLTAWIFFSVLYFGFQSIWTRHHQAIDWSGRFLFLSWLLFSWSVIERIAQTPPVVMQAVFILASLLLARDIYRSARNTRQLFDIALSLGGLAVLIYSLKVIPWPTLFQDISASLNIDAQMLFLLFITYVGLALVIGWLFQQKSNIWQKSWFIPMVMLFVALVQITALGRILYARFHTLSTPSYDFNLFAQMFHNMAQTGQPITTLERNMPLSHFKVHLSPIFYLLLPMHLLLRSPAALNVVQGFIVASGILPMILIARHFKFSIKLQAAFLIIYLASTALISSNFYDLHENVFLVPILLWLIWAIERKSTLGLALFTLLTLAIKEDAALYVWALAAFTLFDRKMVRQSIAIFLVSGAWFIAALSYLNTYGDGAMTGRFESLIAIPQLSLLAVPYAVWRNPGFILTQIFQPGKLSYLFQMMAPLAFMPILGRKITRWILLVPFLLMNLMVDYPYQFNMRFQYNYGSYILLFYLSMLFISDYLSPEPAAKTKQDLKMESQGIKPCQPSADSNFEPIIKSSTNRGTESIPASIHSKQTAHKIKNEKRRLPFQQQSVYAVPSAPELPLIPRILLISAMTFGLIITGAHLKAYEVYPQELTREKDQIATMKAAMDEIPKGASVLASGFLTGYLYDRETLYDLTYNVTWNTYYPADYIVIDLRPGHATDHEDLVPRFLKDGYEIKIRYEDQIMILSQH